MYYPPELKDRVARALPHHKLISAWLDAGETTRVRMAIEDAGPSQLALLGAWDELYKGFMESQALVASSR